MPTLLGEKRDAIWLIGQVLQQRRWVDLSYRRPIFQAHWTTLCFACGQVRPRRKACLASRREKQVKWFNMTVKGSRP